MGDCVLSACAESVSDTVKKRIAIASISILVDTPLVTSDLVGLLLMLLCAPAPLKVSTELTRLYTGLYSALLDLTELNLSFHGFCGSTLGTSGLVP